MRNVQVRGEIGSDVVNWPVASSKRRKLMRTTIVRMNVARSEPMFSTPILAKIAVRAANTADRNAHSCQDSIVINVPFVVGGVIQLSESEKHGCVPGDLVGLVGVFDAAPDIAEQMIVVVQIVAPSDADTRGRGRAD
jgi:hypothetical protein